MKGRVANGDDYIGYFMQYVCAVCIAVSTVIGWSDM
jgi:hypothetical protein